MVASANNRKYRYTVMFPEKCLNSKLYGKTEFIFRSSWEKRVLMRLEVNINVAEWGYELPDMMVEYLFQEPGETAPKKHRYFPDVYVGFRRVDGTLNRMVIEIKPKKETQAPKKPVRMTEKAKKNWVTAQITWAKNQSKWLAAAEHFRKMGIKFSVMTEDVIFGNKQTKTRSPK